MDNTLIYINLEIHAISFCGFVLKNEYLLHVGKLVFVKSLRYIVYQATNRQNMV